ncbi:MAG: hypothetical protein JXQ94_10765 [Maricaulis maris]
MTHAQEADPMAPARAFIAWSSDVNQTNTEIMALMERIFEADEYGVSVREGLMTEAEGEDGLDRWRRELDVSLAGLEARVAVLAAGPELVPDGMEKIVDTLTRNLDSAFLLVGEVLDVAEDAARQDIAGKMVDDFVVYEARYAVLQNYYSGLVANIEAALESVDDRHPQGPLLRATAINIESAIIGFELGRLSFGGTPSDHAVDDPQAVFDDNQRAVAREIDQATALFRIMQDSFARVPRSTPEEQRMMGALDAMVASFPDSFQVEIEGAALFDGLAERIAQGGTNATFDFADELTAYEAARDALNAERIRLASDL